MPRPISARELRTKYLEFFSARGHALIPSASLVPAGDPTVLFTTAGMHPLVPYLLGEPHPAGPRLAGTQRCVRTGDIDEVGDDTHLTFFEMLGNWSLGDYFRAEAITWSFELLTGERWLALPLDRLGVTCFGGNEHAPRDEEAARIWRALGVQRIAFLADNWWGPAGATGPCGPDTEMFYWVGSDPAPPRLDLSDRRWVEIWNDVFMDRNRTASGALLPLPRPNVDTGMGFERTLTALGGLTSVYEVETVRPLLLRLRSLATAHDERALRIQTDHLRAACFLISDGVEPANKGGGYILRRLLRRAMVLARRLGQPPRWHQDGVAAVQESLGDLYPELDGKLAAAVVAAEASKFERTLGRGLRVLERQRALDGRVAFDLFQTYGFPFELTRELALGQGKRVDEEGFRAELERHRELSRTTSAGAFAGGLADHGAEIVRYHTLTHLLHAALRLVLGDQVTQRGSNITRERLRFDFSHPRKVTPEELGRVEATVNRWLERDLVVERATMSEPEARAVGAVGAFGEKYGETVSVYAVTDRATGEVVSREFCGGPHVASTRDLPGRLHLVREEAVSAGIRRIKAVLR